MSAGETIPANNAASKEPFSSIDSALQSGLRDPRERVALLRLEQALVDFMTGDPCVGWMEVGGPANSLVLLPNKNPPTAATPGPMYQSSFHRLLVHRLSDRFGIIREKGLILDNSLRLIKIPESKVPQTLLRDLDPAEYSVGAASAGTPGTPSSTIANRTSPILARSDSGGNGGGGKPRKVKIMKRQSSQPMKSSSGNSSSGGNGGGRRESRRGSSSSDLESREKAYAEARARIFSDGSTEEAKSTSSQNGETDDSLGTSGDGLAQAVASRLSLSEYTTASPSPASPRQGQPSPETTTPDQTRAVYRNRAEEAADPDFKRGAAAVVFQQNNMYYGVTPSSSQYGYASALPGGTPIISQPNNLTASAPVFYPNAPAAPYAAAYPANAWHQPPTQALQRPANRSNQGR